MIHVLVAVWLTAIGLLLVLPASPRFGPWGTAALSPAVGTAAYLVIGSILTTIGAFDVIVTLLIATAVATTTVWLCRQSVASENWSAHTRTGAIALGGAALVALLALGMNATRFTVDSYAYLMSASIVEESGSLADVPTDRLALEQLAVPLVHATGWIDGTGYSPVAGPLFAAAALATLAWLATRSYRRWGMARRSQAVLLGSAGGLLLTTNRFLFNVTYVNGHMLFALLLLASIGIIWSSQVEQDARGLYVAGICLAALALLRAESLPVLTFFVVAALASEVWTKQERLTIAAGPAVTSILWFGLVMPQAAGEGRVDTTLFYGNAALGALLLAFASLAHVPRLRSLTRLAPAATLLGAATLLAWHVAQSPTNLISSVSALATNMAYWGYWGMFWYVVPLLVTVALVTGRLEYDRIWTVGLIGFAIALPLLADLREGAYRVGGGDSGNRMLLHVVPIMVLVAILAAGKAWRAAADSDAT